MKVKIYLVLIILNCFGILAVPTIQAQAKVSCNFSTYLADQDPNGTNLRTAPNKNSQVLKMIKSEYDIVIEISGYSNGWFEIKGAAEVGDSDKVLFGGRGWIHSSLVGMAVAGPDPRLYAEPRKKSRILMKLKTDESPLKLLECQGDWVKVSTGGKIGWLSPDGQCGNPLTTCP